MSSIMTVFWIGVTIGAYGLSLEARKRFASPLTTPVLFSTAVVIAVLLATHGTLRQYDSAKETISMLLGPATVALAIPLFKNRGRLRMRAVAVLAGFAAGLVSTTIVAALLSRACGLAPSLVVSMALKSTTAPIAIEIAKIIHADPALTAIFVICTGMIGAAFGPGFLNLLRVTDPVARGVALGTIAHGQGTAQAATGSEVAGATAGLAMGLAGVTMGLLAPLLLPLVTQ